MKIGQIKAALNGGAVNPAVVQQSLDAMGSRHEMSVYDSPQAGLAFAVSQATYIEREVNRVLYPDIQYPSLIPVDTSAPEWAPSITYFSSDMTGAAKWINSFGGDIPNADTKREKFKQSVHMAAIGYGWSLEEVGQAQLLGVPLASDKAMAARRAYEEFVDTVALSGDSSVNFEGLTNNSGITPANVADNSGATSKLWANKTADEILTDLNEPLSDTYSTSKTVEMADTVLMSVARLNYIATTPRSSTSDTTILQYYQRNNIYTLTTGQPLMIRALRGLETAGATSTQRMITYRRSPEVLKLHIPMTHRFLAPVTANNIYFEVPGIFRLGGLDIRRPGAVRYRDGF